MEKLTEHGWYLRDAPETSGGLPPVEDHEPKGDPVARKILDEAFLFSRCHMEPCAFGSVPRGTWVTTASGLLEMAGEAEEDLRAAGWPDTPEEVENHLGRISHALQTDHLLIDPYLDHFYATAPSFGQRREPDPNKMRMRREGYLHVERWKKEGGAREDLWAFTALRPGWSIPDENIERCVWHEVRRLDGIDDPDDPFGFVF